MPGPPAFAESAAAGARAPSRGELPRRAQKKAPTEDRLRRLEDEIRTLREELAAVKREAAVASARAERAEIAKATPAAEPRVRLSGYGSLRAQSGTDADQRTTFTFRRFVLNTEARVAPKLRFYSELEYERFRKLELERRAAPGSGGLRVEQELEGSSGSEISLEQAWLEWTLDPRLQLRAGALLVPLGRFNLEHDDNGWVFPRRSLVDRGIPVLPSAAAWDELGVGVRGRFETVRGTLGYELDLVNGVVLAPEVEQVLQTRNPKRDKLELEAGFEPRTGAFELDGKDAKSLAGRLYWAPAPDHELGLSFYTGRYTPSYLADARVLAFAADALTRARGFELEAEFASTTWLDTNRVAASLARRALADESANGAAFDPVVETEIAFKLGGLARRRSGYWIELRRPLWPSWLPRGGYESPQLVPALRVEQVWLEDDLESVGFADGELTELSRRARRFGRVSVGLAFRPTPLAVLSAAYEYTWSGSGDPLAAFPGLGLATTDDAAHTFLLGVAFGF